jgi:hypothetical protein
VRRVIVPDGMGVEHLSSVKSVISGILKPHRQVVLIVTILDEDWKSTYPGQALSSKLKKKKKKKNGRHTIWRIQVSYISVVC